MHYSHFDDVIETPFLTYTMTTINFFAEDKVFHSFFEITLELYTDKKDWKLEHQLEELLNSKDIPWEKSEDIWIDEENMFEIVYGFTIAEENE